MHEVDEAEVSRDPAAAARELLRRERVGVLSTLSVRHGGAPFGSLAPYALSPRGAPTLLLSELAQHTRNVQSDPRASLLVADAAALARDPRRTPRVIVVGQILRVGPEEEQAVRERYLSWHPSARELLALDFRFHELLASEVMYVGGLAQASFLAPEALSEGGRTP